MPWAAAVARVEASGLVSFTPHVEFRHPLVRAAVYYSAEPADRRIAHAALAGALDAAADIDRRAWHLGAAATGPDERAAALLEASAERATLRGGSATAAACLRRAAELTGDPARAAGRLLEAARAELTAGRGPQARELLERARANALAPRHDIDAAWTEALIHLVAGNIREPAALLAGALPRIGDADPELASVPASPPTPSRSPAATSSNHRHGLNSPRARSLSPTMRRHRVDHRAHQRSRRPPDRPTGHLDAHAAPSRGERGCRSPEPPLDRRPACPRRVLHTVLAAADLLDDRAWDDLVHAWAQLSRATGALAALPLALSWRSWLEVLQGRFGSAQSHLAEIDDVVSLTGGRGLLGSPVPAQVLRDAWHGNEDATRTGARRMMQDAHERGQGIGIDHAYAALTVLELGAGRYGGALRTARRVCEHDSVGVATVALADTVEAAVRSDDRDLATQALERLSVRAAVSGTPWANGMLARSQAVAATGGEADGLYRSALDELARTTIATEIARTQLLYGEWLRRARRRKDAREPLHDALDFFEAVGASGFAGRAAGRAHRDRRARAQRGRHPSTCSRHRRRRSRAWPRQARRTIRSPSSSTSRPAPSSTTCARRS